MGIEIAKNVFKEEDFSQFKDRLLEETKILKRWFDESSFDQGDHVCGLELEAWLVNGGFTPSPSNDSFLSALNSDLATNELAQFNFELNAVPHAVKGGMLSKFKHDVAQSWKQCVDCADKQGIRTMMIGSLPTLRPEMLDLKHISSMQRYRALNQQIMNLRNQEPLRIDISGKDHLEMQLHDVMLESAATSLQIHLQVNIDEAVRFYNASHIASAFTVAAGANSPYLFGKALWDETRIAIFEQAVAIASFRNKHGESIGRVTFGSGYAQHSLIEPFLENVSSYPILLPALSDTDPELLRHLKLHNGCIWRWNRPLIGTGKDERPHLRMEHRVVASGPTVDDVVANIALFLGIVYFLSNMDTPPETQLRFSKTKDNFYQAARYGLAAQTEWIDGKTYAVQSLLLDTILPEARQALLDKGFTEEEVSYYIDDIITNRIQSGQNGAAWQKGFVAKYGMDFHQLTERYYINQESGVPVHEWDI